jgi:hypothetical protein
LLPGYDPRAAVSEEPPPPQTVESLWKTNTNNRIAPMYASARSSAVNFGVLAGGLSLDMSGLAGLQIWARIGCGREDGWVWIIPNGRMFLEVC